ncbi:THAP domain-containing protein 1 [Nymphon striatum]|nr:THAP domain-containing protein 1 [Nymphon striatum]
MGYKCCAFGCRSGYKTTTANTNQQKVSFHQFPLKNSDLLRIWVAKVNRKDYMPTTCSRLCSLHFQDSCFLSIRSDSNGTRAGQQSSQLLNKRCLKKDAIPTIFSNCPGYMNKEETLRKSNATSGNRLMNENKMMEQQIEQFWDNDSIKSIDDILCALKNDKSVPSGFNYTTIDGCLLLLHVKVFENIPELVASISVKNDMTISAAVRSEVLALNYFKEFLTPDNKLVLISALFNVMAVVKTKASMNKPCDTPEVLMDEAKQSIQKCIEIVTDVNIEKQLNFFKEQLELMWIAKGGRRYSPTCMVNSYMLYSTSRTCYEELRNQHNVCLPSERTLRKITHTIGKTNNYDYLKSRSSNLNSFERTVVLVIDEIYAAKRVEYAATKGQVLGATAEGDIASTILGFMISSVCGKHKDIVSLYPVKRLNANKLEECCLAVLKLLDDIGYNVVAISVDNHPVNRSYFVSKLCEGNLKSQVANPVNGAPLFLLFDAVHNMKNIFNNFEGKKVLCYPNFDDPISNVLSTAKFEHMIDLYDMEVPKPIKMAHKLSMKCLYPRNIEKMSVKLALAVFHESTVNALRYYCQSENKEWVETADLVDLVITLWSIINVKTTTAGSHKRDEARKPITSKNDWQLSFLIKFANFLEVWHVNKRNCLSKQTYLALRHMCVTLPAIAQYLLELGFQYVLLGQLQSDVIESRFGRYRQMSGANYFVSVKQILEAELKIKAASLLKFSGIDQLNLLTSGESASGLKDESHLDQIALDFTNVIVEKGCGNLNSADKNVIYYVTGAVVRSHIRQSKFDSCQKILSDGPLSPLTEENVDGIDDATKVFLQDINRGGLCQPSSHAFDLCMKAYTIFIVIYNDNELIKWFLSFKNHKEFFMLLYSHFVYSENDIIGNCFKGHDFKSIVVRFFNCLMKNFVKKLSNYECNKKRKIEKLSGEF